MMDKLKKTSADIRRLIIDKAYECGQSAHLGGALSMIDIMSVLYEKVLTFKADEPECEQRDIFILSKGHTVLGYVATLFHYNYFPKEVFDTFQTNGSKLIAHPIKNLAYGIESSNGSLGQGISYASGMALGYKKRGMGNRVFVMMGDGECNEGSVWEAAQLSAELSLNNLVVIIDVNGYRNDGMTAYGANSSLNLQSMWSSFGWNAVSIDGHNFDEIMEAFEHACGSDSKPTAIIANTVKGKGFSFMESNNDWHHNRITKVVYEQCLAELGKNNAN
ncbi:Ferredoxin fas2 [Marinomonas spartinae]|uniref:transketolase n=1 Tax=Marinomonas spartinae TaxID=1792290 RepID=UPI000808F36B|nr:transketolase [Marinomonas spartinae]SBS40433.1 Ferredoxin fas2 [Marinomonas spartinae]